MGSPDNKKIFNLAAIAVAIYVSESFIPKPVPWLRLGLANVLVIIALIQYGLKAAFSVTITKVIAGSIVTGKMFTPFFFFTLFGSLVSLLVMYLAMMLPFSIIGISVAGAVSHNLIQLILAVLIFLPFASLKVLYPIFSTLAVATGIFTGIVSSKTLHLISR